MIHAQNLLFGGMVVLFCTSIGPSIAYGEDADPSRISDTPIELQVESLPERPSPLLELGESYFDTGPIDRGWELPGGAVWHPSLVVWGIYRTALQTFETSDGRTTEWSNRLDLFGNLALSGTERVLLGVRPLDQSGQFTRYTFQTPTALEEEEGSFEQEFNFDLTTFFFEGDFGEILPFLDTRDARSLDLALAVGRQPLVLQDGILLNDSVDSVGISKLNLKPRWAVNHRVAVIWGFNELHRTNLSRDDDDAQLFGISNDIDWRWSTVELDALYVTSTETGNSFHGGVGAIQRLGHYSTTVRILGSLAEDEETPHAADGALLFVESSRTVSATNDLVYLNGFWAIESFRSASRDPSAGGPVGRTGILFEAAGIGRYRAALASNTDDALGVGAGYQLFFNETRTHLLVELGHRHATEDTGQRATAIGARVQHAIGRRSVLRFDIFTSYGDSRLTPEAVRDEDFDFGGRLEWMLHL
ncbi:MAG: hypothetical protein KDD69_13800 [Bdellovibrionales bacterium]|nr:hypothetical protein [Bdellovibrionales bacterium]